jgi:chaperonin GroEL (HSP60 family)
VELAELQDREVGDGTTSVVIVAAELLKVTFHSLILPFYMHLFI